MVDLALSAPDGAWSVRVDAATGAVVSVEDTRLIRKITDETLTAAERLAAVYRPGLGSDRHVRRFRRAGRAPMTQSIANAARAAGTGVVFDPDPRTTLNNNALADDLAGQRLHRRLLHPQPAGHHLRAAACTG